MHPGHAALPNFSARLSTFGSNAHRPVAWHLQWGGGSRRSKGERCGGGGGALYGGVGRCQHSAAAEKGLHGCIHLRGGQCETGGKLYSSRPPCCTSPRLAWPHSLPAGQFCRRVATVTMWLTCLRARAGQGRRRGGRRTCRAQAPASGLSPAPRARWRVRGRRGGGVAACVQGC